MWGFQRDPVGREGGNDGGNHSLRGRDEATACRIVKSQCEPGEGAGAGILTRERGHVRRLLARSFLMLSLLSIFVVPAAFAADDAPPAASFTFSPSEPVTGEVVTFDGSRSTCASTPCAYVWSDDGPDGPGGTSWRLGTGQVLTFTFHSAGTKHVRLRVTDAWGRTSTTEQDVTVASSQQPPLAPANTVAPAITGTPQQGQTLTTSNGTWNNSPTSYAYQWQDCDSSGSNCTNVSGATSSSYTLTSGDVGHTIRAVVTASNSAGSALATSAQTAAVSPPPGPTAVFTYSPSAPTTGQTVNFDATGSSCSPTPCTYAWDHGAGTATFGTAATATYTYQYTGQKTPTLTVTDALGRTSTVEHDVSVSAGTLSPPGNTAAPQISGSAQQNSALTTSNGSWTGSPTSYTYQWQDCGAGQCSNISGATSSSYTLQSSDVDATIDVVVTATNSGGSASATSAQTATVTAASGGGGGGGGGGVVPCALSTAANSCWATNTGVQGATGYSEAQIEAGAPGLTHYSGDLTIKTAGTTIDHYWISGCVGIQANNVTIKDSLITPNGDNCTGGINASGGSQASAINNGRNTTGTLITDTTVDGGNNPSQAYGVSIDAGTVTRTNSFGFVDNFWTSGCAAQGCMTTFTWSGDYSHDPAGMPYTGGGHEQLFMFYGATYLTLTNSYGYFNSAGDGSPTGVLNWQPGGSGTQYASQGPVAHVDVDHSFLDANGHGVDIIDSCGVGGNEIVQDNVLDSSSGVSYWRTSGTGPHGTAGAGNVWSGNTDLSGAAYGDPGSTNC